MLFAIIDAYFWEILPENIFVNRTKLNLSCLMTLFSIGNLILFYIKKGWS